MHKFLRAAGFPDLDEQEVHKLIWEKVVTAENISARLDLSESVMLLEYRMPVNEHIGICAAVLYSDDYFELKYSYPYFSTFEITNNEACVLERHTMTETYSGVLDDYDTGISLIFFVSNPIIYRQRPDAGTEQVFHGTALAAFANEGIVILPVVKNEFEPLDTSPDFRETFIESVFGSTGEDMEMLAVEDVTRYRQLTDRMETEDLYSVVEQSLMPSGVECDLYSVIGEILECEENINFLTQEKLYLVKLTCNDIVFWLCIRQADLVGEPMKGRRIKCRLWMQGSVNMHAPDLRL